MTIPLLLSIAGGGAFGAVARHGLASALTKWLGTGFPFGILACNVFGSFLMGALISAFALKGQVSEEMRAFLSVGFLGAFTTFSTFSLDTITLMERGAYLLAGIYVVMSVAVSVLFLLLGMALMRGILA